MMPAALRPAMLRVTVLSALGAAAAAVYFLTAPADAPVVPHEAAAAASGARLPVVPGGALNIDGGQAARWFGQLQRKPAPIINSQVPLARQIDALVDSGKPQSLYDAYWMVRDCMAFQQTGQRAYTGLTQAELGQDDRHAMATLCAGLTERLKTSRLDFLARAAKGGLSVAAEAFLEEGPFGDKSALRTRPDDPLVLAWKKQAIDQLTTLADNGDMLSLTMLQSQFYNGTEVAGKNRVLALTYAIALQKNFQTIGYGADAAPYVDIPRSYREAGVTAEEIAAATAAAEPIAARFRERKQRGDW